MSWPGLQFSTLQRRFNEVRLMNSNLSFHKTEAVLGEISRPSGRTIAALLGHATIQMSARYTHATDEGTRRAVEKLLVFGGSGHKAVTKQEGQIL
jgi:integrase